MKLTVALGMLVLVTGIWACGGASKPPLQPDSDTAGGLAGDGAPDSAASAQPAAPTKK